MSVLLDRVAAAMRRANVREDPGVVDYGAMARAVIEDLGLTEEVHEQAAVSVPDVNEDGSPMMDDRLVVPVQRQHFEWVTMRRWVTPDEEVGERQTWEEMRAGWGQQS